MNQTAGKQNLKPHADLVRAIQEALTKGLMWNQALILGQARSVKELASTYNVSDRYVSHLMRLALLSPVIMRRIFKDDIPHDLTLGKLKTDFPLDWGEQEALFS